MKLTIISMVIASALVGGAFFFARGNSQDTALSVQNVSIADGTQIIEVKAKGGYLPRKSIAKAGIPTILRFNTSGTFDCSAIVRIPSMNLTKNLPPSGITDIALGSAPIGKVQGTCGMGMYPFEIDFQS